MNLKACGVMLVTCRRIWKTKLEADLNLWSCPLLEEAPHPRRDTDGYVFSPWYGSPSPKGHGRLCFQPLVFWYSPRSFSYRSRSSEQTEIWRASSKGKIGFSILDLNVKVHTLFWGHFKLAFQLVVASHTALIDFFSKEASMGTEGCNLARASSKCLRMFL